MLLLVAISGNAQEFVRVISDDAYIYTEPGVLNMQRITAKKADIFELESHHEEWAGIYMISGTVRYVKWNDVALEYDFSPEYIDFSKNIGLCKEVQTAENQAAEKAGPRYPEDEHAMMAHKKLLLDQHVLNIFRNYHLPAIHHTIFTDCINDSLYRMFPAQ